MSPADRGDEEQHIPAVGGNARHHCPPPPASCMVLDEHQTVERPCALARGELQDVFIEVGMILYQCADSCRQVSTTARRVVFAVAWTFRSVAESEH